MDNLQLAQVLLDQQTELQTSVGKIADVVSDIREQLIRQNGNIETNNERSRNALLMVGRTRDALCYVGPRDENAHGQLENGR